MRNNLKLLGAAGIAGVVGLTGSAFTASNTLGGENVAGYNTDTVSGAITTGIEHTLAADGATIVSTLLTFSTDLLASHAVKAGFGTAALDTCTVDVAANTAACTYTTPPATNTANDFRVAVS